MSSYYQQQSNQELLPSPRPARADARLLQEKIENLTHLVDSLNEAVEDLGTVEVPPLDENFDYYVEVERFETNLIRSALRVTGGSQIKAARLLKLKPTTLNAKIKTLHLLTPGS